MKEENQIETNLFSIVRRNEMLAARRISRRFANFFFSTKIKLVNTSSNLIDDDDDQEEEKKFLFLDENPRRIIYRKGNVYFCPNNATMMYWISLNRCCLD